MAALQEIETQVATKSARSLRDFASGLHNFGYFGGGERSNYGLFRKFEKRLPTDVMRRLSELVAIHLDAGGVVGVISYPQDLLMIQILTRRQFAIHISPIERSLQFRKIGNFSAELVPAQDDKREGVKFNVIDKDQESVVFNTVWKRDQDPGRRFAVLREELDGRWTPLLDHTLPEENMPPAWKVHRDVFGRTG